MTIEIIRKLFEQETSLIARVDNPEYMDWLEIKLAMQDKGIIKQIGENEKQLVSKLRMNDHKFRCWDKKNRTMSYFNLHYDYIYGDYLQNRDVDIMQYIGIQDKNKKEIYELDICELDGKRYWVEFWLGSFCLTLNAGDSLNSFTFSDFTFEELERIIVVGNVWENPELLEIKND